ncbi:MAG: PQQ-dependent sugar dehydrogenase [Bauldia sp.]|nr:PQQ-dependent sugar dehydrogenase [Bauldia sp.]
MAMRHSLVLAAVLAAAPLAACAQQPPGQLGVDLVAEGLESPILVVAPPGDPRLFIVDQAGQVWIVADGAMAPEPFLDIGAEVTFGGEQGLLGLAFHPDYASNGRFFIDHTDRAGNTRVAEYRVSADPNRADPASGVTLMSLEDRRANHNGGWLAFGPDGYLYISNGDGGGGGDPDRAGQNTGSLFGKLLRIDVDAGSPYGIPPTNPFASGGGAAEVFAYGIRNAWRIDFDGDLIFIADVGQGAWEEITVIGVDDAGANLGWNVLEGNHCYNADRCDDRGMVRPFYEYSHDEGCSVTGGYVYRGAAMPWLAGQYFFADYCEGWVRSFAYNGGSFTTDVIDWSRQIGDRGNILSFGEDAAGELYITTSAGRVWKIVPR